MPLQATVALAILLGSPPPQDTLPPLLRASAEALADSQIKEAIRLAERHTRANPKDARGFLALGDAYMGWYPDGRFRALNHYRTAQRLTRRDPVPYYREALLGFRIGGADGERLAADALDRVLEVDPLFPGAWEQWLVLFRNRGGRLAMIRRLVPHVGQPEVAARIAFLYVEEERYPAADSLLDRILADDPDNVAWLARRAQSAFEAGDVNAGATFYRRALAQAEHDSTGALWTQVIGIATPEEFVAWGDVPPDARAAWLESFWARRNPDLFAGINARIAEHFARWRYARRHYPLLHPLILYQRSTLGRTLGLEPSTGEREFHLRCEVYQGLSPATGRNPPLPTASVIADRIRMDGGVLAHLTDEERDAYAYQYRRVNKCEGQVAVRIPSLICEAINQEGTFAFAPPTFFPLGFHLDAMDSTAARIGYNLATGLSDRGITYLRYGPPDHVVFGGDNASDPRCNTDELERWQYPDLGWVRFVKPNAFSRGERVVPEMVFRPMTPPQFEAMKAALTTDRPSVPAELEFGIWTAQFQADDGLTALAVISTRGALAAALVGPTGGDRGTATSDAGHVVLTDAQGRFSLLSHVRDGGDLGRMTRNVFLRGFDRPLALSDLLLARAWEPPGLPLDRTTMLDHVTRDLRFAAGDTIRIYSEVYGLPPTEPDVTYLARYAILATADPERDIGRETWPEALVVEVRRSVRGHRDRLVETLDLGPERISRGIYLLRMNIEDGAGRKSNAATIAFEVK